MKARNVFSTSVLAAALILIFGMTGTKELSVVGSLGEGNQLEGNVVVSVSERVGNINPDIYGLFMEMCYHEFNGGVWAEMLKSRKFAEDDREDEDYGVIRPWFGIGQNDKTYLAHDNTIYYCGKQSGKIVSKNKKDHRSGIGQGGLCLEKAKGYQVRVNLRQENLQDAVTVALEGQNGTYAQQEIKIPNTDWNRFSFTLTPAEADSNGKFTISFRGSGTLWVGTASLMPADNISGFRKDVIEALRAIHPSNIRWPGGNVVSGYRWEDGIGDRDKRPPRFARELWETNDVGMDEFIEFCRLVGTKPYIAVNSGDGSAKEAANLVQYCNGGSNTRYGKLRAKNGHSQPYQVKLWGIGNEMFGNWQIGHVDEETYAKRHLEFAKAMLAADKNIKLVASGARYWKFPRWNQAFFKSAGNYFDYLALHSYAKKYRSKMKKTDLKDPKFAEEFYYYIVSSPYGIEEQIIETDKEIRKALPNRPEVKVAFDEWNCFAYLAQYEEADFALRDGLYTAGVLHAFRRQSNAVTLANFSKVVNAIGMIRASGCGMFLNPQYLVFKMYLEHSGPTLLKTDVKCDSFPAPEYEKGRPQAKNMIPYLDASATISEDGNTVYVAVANLHINKNIKTQLLLDKWDFSPEAKIFELYDEDHMAENTFENPARITIKQSLLTNISNPFTCNFKPHSVTVMEFQKR